MQLGSRAECNRGFPIEELIRHQVIYELLGLTGDCQNLLTSLELKRIHRYRMASERPSGHKHTIFIDEASGIFGKEATMTQMFMQSREYGEALVISVHLLTSLHEDIRGNVHTWIILGQSDFQNIRDCANMLGLDPKYHQLLGSLPRGTAIVKTATGYIKPYLLHIPLVDMQQDYMADGEVDKINENHPVLRELMGMVEPVRMRFAKEVREQEKREEKERKETERKAEMNEFLLIVNKKPFLGTRDYYKGLEWPDSKGNRVKKEALEKGLISEHRVGKTKIITLSEAGKEYIGSGYAEIPGKGSMEHRYYQHKVCPSLSGKGYQAEVEKFWNGKSIDVLGRKKDEILAVEIELQPVEHVIENIRKDIDAGAKRVLVLTPKEKLKELSKYINERLDSDMMGKVSIEAIQHYV